jgi:hypothetical protein
LQRKIWSSENAASLEKVALKKAWRLVAWRALCP